MVLTGVGQVGRITQESLYRGRGTGTESFEGLVFTMWEERKEHSKQKSCLNKVIWIGLEYYPLQWKKCWKSGNEVYL